MGKKKSRTKRTSSGLKKVHKAARQEKIPALHEAKRRRLIARLKSFGQNGSMDESINTLRRRLHPFVAKPKVKLVNYRDTLISIIRGTYEDNKSKCKDT